MPWLNFAALLSAEEPPPSPTEASKDLMAHIFKLGAGVSRGTREEPLPWLRVTKFPATELFEGRFVISRDGPYGGNKEMAKARWPLILDQDYAEAEFYALFWYVRSTFEVITLIPSFKGVSAGEKIPQ